MANWETETLSNILQLSPSAHAYQDTQLADRPVWPGLDDLGDIFRLSIPSQSLRTLQDTYFDNRPVG